VFINDLHCRRYLHNQRQEGDGFRVASLQSFHAEPLSARVCREVVVDALGDRVEEVPELGLVLGDATPGRISHLRNLVPVVQRGFAVKVFQLNQLLLGGNALGGEDEPAASGDGV